MSIPKSVGTDEQYSEVRVLRVADVGAIVGQARCGEIGTSMSEYSIEKNATGFWEISPKPDSETLARHYREKYFGASDGHNPYAFGYTDEELEHKFLDATETQAIVGDGRRTLFEVGCGEGFFLEHFQRLGWEVRGIDFTSDGVQAFFPHLAPLLTTGDAFELLQAEVDAGRQYDMVVCNNVLEHVIEPFRLIDLLGAIVKPNGLVRITVPNDFSWLQGLAVSRGNVPDQFWVLPPDHLNYFNVDMMSKFLKESGWSILDLLSSFPVDLFLLNEDSNYVRTKERGRACHFARIAFEVGLWKQGIDKLIAFRRGCAASGVGRDLTVYAKPNK